MDNLQQQIAEIARQIPGYAGYQAKERRRDADKLVRTQLAAKYEVQRTRLTRLQQQAALEYADKLERLDQKLQRFIARLKTAPRGYAGWFDAAQITESDLDQLTQFDSTLTDGVALLKTQLDQIAAAMKTKKGLDSAVSACADALDTLNDQFDQREQFVAMGKKPSLSPIASKPPASPLEALQTKKGPPQELVALTSLKVNDAVSYDNVDYIVTGKITFTTAAGSFWAFLLQDRDQKRWLRVGPGGEIAVCQEITLSVPSEASSRGGFQSQVDSKMPRDDASPLPDSLTYEKQSFTRTDMGSANVTVEGAGGVKRGSVNYARYSAEPGRRLWIEDFGTETRIMSGQTVDAFELKLYRK